MVQQIMSITRDEIPELPPEPEALRITYDDLGMERAERQENIPDDIIFAWKAELYQQALTPERDAELMNRTVWPEGCSPIALRTLRGGMATLRSWGIEDKTASDLIVRRYGTPAVYNTRPDGSPAYYKVPNLAEDYLKAVEWMKTTLEITS